MYKTLHKKQGSVTVQLRFARSSVTFCAKRDRFIDWWIQSKESDNEGREFKKRDSRADSYRANQPSGKDQVERFIQLDGFGGNKDHV